MGTLLNRRRYMGGGSSLPYDAELEYIRSNGTQIINLQYYPNPNTTFIMDVQFVDNGNTNKDGMNNIIYGTSDSGTGVFSANFGSSASQGNNIYFWNDKKYGSGGQVRIIFYPDPFTIKGKMTITRYNANFLNRNVSLTGKTTTNTTPLYVFGNATTSLNRYDMKVFSIKIQEENTVIRDIIPVRVGTTGYLYDKVSGTLFGNDGTGDFILGPDKTT